MEAAVRTLYYVHVVSNMLKAGGCVYTNDLRIAAINMYKFSANLNLLLAWY